MFLRVKIGKILASFRPKAQVVENKNQKFEFFFIPCHTKTYVENAVYIFVDFRIKRAGSSNYGGAPFRPPAEKAGKKGKSKKGKNNQIRISKSATSHNP